MAAAGGLTCAASPAFLQVLQSSGRGLLLVKSPANLNSCISNSASALCSIWATTWSFLSILLFFSFSQSQDAVGNVNGFCFFMLTPHVLLSSKAKWNVSTFSRSPKVSSTRMHEQMQLPKITGRAVLGLRACSDPNLDKLPVKGRPWGLLLFQHGIDTSKTSGPCALRELIYY